MHGNLKTLLALHGNAFFDSGSVTLPFHIDAVTMALEDLGWKETGDRVNRTFKHKAPPVPGHGRPVVMLYRNEEDPDLTDINFYTEQA